MPEGVTEGILRGLYRLRSATGKGPLVRLVGSGTILREVEAAAELLEAEHGVAVEVYSATSLVELAREAADTERWNLLHPEEPPRKSYAATVLAGDAPVVIASDYQKTLAEPLRAQIAAPCRVLGTDGFGRSDTRARLRHFFEVDRRFVTLAALVSLAEAQQLPAETARAARDAFGIDPDKPNPRMV
jgi:pyruvate dehydrogenase E1 component